MKNNARDAITQRPATIPDFPNGFEKWGNPIASEQLHEALKHVSKYSGVGDACWTYHQSGVIAIVIINNGDGPRKGTRTYIGASGYFIIEQRPDGTFVSPWEQVLEPSEKKT